MPKKSLELHCTISTGEYEYFVYRLPAGCRKAKIKNSVVLFYKTTDGFAYPVVAPNVSFLEGWIAGLGTVGELRYCHPITDAQYFAFGEDLPPDSAVSLPGRLIGVYAG